MTSGGVVLSVCRYDDIVRPKSAATACRAILTITEVIMGRNFNMLEIIAPSLTPDATSGGNTVVNKGLESASPEYARRALLDESGLRYATGKGVEVARLCSTSLGQNQCPPVSGFYRQSIRLRDFASTTASSAVGAIPDTSIRSLCRSRMSRFIAHQVAGLDRFRPRPRTYHQCVLWLVEGFQNRVVTTKRWEG